MEGKGNWAQGPGLCKIGPTDNPDAFLGTFRRVAMTAGWDGGAWALWLAPYLTGEAQVAYMALNDEQAVKMAILDQVILPTEQCGQKF